MYLYKLSSARIQPAYFDPHSLQATLAVFEQLRCITLQKTLKRRYVLTTP